MRFSPGRKVLSGARFKSRGESTEIVRHVFFEDEDGTSGMAPRTSISLYRPGHGAKRAPRVCGASTFGRAPSLRAYPTCPARCSEHGPPGRRQLRGSSATPILAVSASMFRISVGGRAGSLGVPSFRRLFGPDRAAGREPVLAAKLALDAAHDGPDLTGSKFLGKSPRRFVHGLGLDLGLGGWGWDSFDSRRRGRGAGIRHLSTDTLGEDRVDQSVGAGEQGDQAQGRVVRTLRNEAACSDLLVRSWPTCTTNPQSGERR